MEMKCFCLANSELGFISYCPLLPSSNHIFEEEKPVTIQHAGVCGPKSPTAGERQRQHAGSSQ